MAPKTVKSTRTTAAKKAPAKKAATKKTTVKSTPHVQAAPVVAAAPATGCPCGAQCKCGHKHGGFGRFVKKLIVFIIIFALGFAAAKLCPFCAKYNFHRAPRVHFVNGCVDVASVKEPRLMAALPVMDINQDGCITREEYRAVKKQMRREIREMHVREMD